MDATDAFREIGRRLRTDLLFRADMEHRITTFVKATFENSEPRVRIRDLVTGLIDFIFGGELLDCTDEYQYESREFLDKVIADFKKPLFEFEKNDPDYIH